MDEDDLGILDRDYAEALADYLDEAPPYDPTLLDELTTGVLREIAASRGIPTHAKMTREEIVALLSD